MNVAEQAERIVQIEDGKIIRDSGKVREEE